MPEGETETEKRPGTGPAGGKKDVEAVEIALQQLDARGNWFEEKVTTALKIKSDKWKKMSTVPEYV